MLSVVFILDEEHRGHYKVFEGEDCISRANEFYRDMKSMNPEHLIEILYDKEASLWRDSFDQLSWF